jgi:polyhydroxybutyrate depolymerase
LCQALSLAIAVASFFSTTGPLFSQTQTLHHDGRDRTYLVHLPAGYNPNSSNSLIIAMHGGFGSALNLQRTSELSEKSDEAGFIVVYPEGVASLLGIRTWNAGGCCGFAVDNEIDDVGFISSLIDTLSADFNIDPARIYATGLSNGGMMAYRLACELPDRIAAIAPVAATMAADLCEPSSSIPIIHFHSFLDENVPLHGGSGTGVSSFDHPSLDSVFAVWSRLNGCETEKDTVQNDDALVLVKWQGCSENAELQLYITRDGGHSWPGGKRALNQTADPTSEVIIANDLMWEFFQVHPLPLPSRVQSDDVEGLPRTFVLQQNYPNPFNPSTRIDFTISASERVRLHVYDLLGNTVKRLVDRNLPAGTHSIFWNGTDEKAAHVSAGVYFYRLTVGQAFQTRKLLLIR